MELAPLGSLRILLDNERERVVGNLRVQRQVLKGVAEAMAYLHGRKPKPLLHHDLKSANVLLWPTSEDGLLPKVSDFGLASGIGSTTTASMTSRLKAGGGTLLHMAVLACLPHPRAT